MDIQPHMTPAPALTPSHITAKKLVTPFQSPVTPSHAVEAASVIHVHVLSAALVTPPHSPLKKPVTLDHTCRQVFFALENNPVMNVMAGSNTLRRLPPSTEKKTPRRFHVSVMEAQPITKKLMMLPTV